MKAKIIFLAMMISIIVASCGNNTETKVITAKEDGKQYTVEIEKTVVAEPTIQGGKINDFGNGVYYFWFARDEFVNQLSLFIKQHQELKIIGSSSDNYSPGTTCGYFVYFEPRVPCPCDTIKK